MPRPFRKNDLVRILYWKLGIDTGNMVDFELERPVGKKLLEFPDKEAEEKIRKLVDWGLKEKRVPSCEQDTLREEVVNHFKNLREKQSTKKESASV